MILYRPVNERIHDYLPVELSLPEDILLNEVKRCQDCGVPFCHAVGCPLGNALPEMNLAVAAGRWESALEILLSTSPFPEFTCRVCPGLCEGSCVRSLNEAPVACRQVEKEVIEKAFAEGLISPRLPAGRLGLNAAVIGSGPAGLAAAHFLNQAGAKVTVYECDAKAGGFLRYGIPDFKLEKSVIDRRLKLMQKEGVTFECEVEAGGDISRRLLLKRHDVLILAMGARAPRDLPVPGRGLKGVYFAMDYLSAQNRVLGDEAASLPPELNAEGRRVIVIGGGDTGADCVGTAWRQGAREVLQVEIMPRPPIERAASNPWPQWPRVFKTGSSHQEGGDRLWSVETSEFLSANKKSGELGFVKGRMVQWEEKEEGLIRPVALPGSEFIREADMALLALGFTGVEPGRFLTDLELKPDKRGRLERKPSGQVMPRVYACGDAATGPSLVVKAISDGLSTARSVLQDLLQNQEDGKA